jgi:hypothetical protein
MLFPTLLTLGALIAAFASYRGIRRGGARFYTLEREAILRRASFSLFSSVLLFVAALTLLAVEREQFLTASAEAGEETESILVPQVTETVSAFPPLPTNTPTPDPSIPTVTPTPIICRAVVQSVNGLRIRDTPGGQEIDILADGAILTLVSDEPPVEADGFVWRKVRPVIGDEGWVSAEFIVIGAPCE